MGGDNHGGRTGLDRVVDTGEQAVGGQSLRAETCREWFHLYTYGNTAVHKIMWIQIRSFS